VSKPTTKDDGQPIEDDYVSPFITWDRCPMRADLKDAKFKPGTDYDGNPCTDVHGVLLNAVNGHDVGDEVIVGGGSLVKLKAKIEKGITLGRLRDGIFVRIEHDRMIGRMKNFEVIPNPTDLINAEKVDLDTFPGVPRDEKAPPF
jgi:hypothetical protein